MTHTIALRILKNADRHLNETVLAATEVVINSRKSTDAQIDWAFEIAMSL